MGVSCGQSPILLSQEPFRKRVNRTQPIGQRGTSREVKYMSTDEIKSAAPMKLLAHVFGKKEGQSLQEFANEIKDVKNDTQRGA